MQSRLIHLFPVLFMMLMMSCVSENEQLALEELKRVYDTEDIHVSYGTDNADSTGAQDYILIEISSEYFGGKSFDPGLTASVISFIWFNNLPADQLDQYALIKVAIKVDGVTEKFVFERENLHLIHESLQILDEYIDAIMRQDYDEAQSYFDSTGAIHVSARQLDTLYSEMNKDFGPLERYKFYGFDFEELDTGEGMIPALFVYCYEYRGEEVINTKYIIDMSEANRGKMLGFESL